jgi:hypothetical protein
LRAEAASKTSLPNLLPLFNVCLQRRQHSKVCIYHVGSLRMTQHAAAAPAAVRLPDGSGISSIRTVMASTAEDRARQANSSSPDTYQQAIRHLAFTKCVLLRLHA